MKVCLVVCGILALAVMVRSQQACGSETCTEQQCCLLKPRLFGPPVETCEDLSQPDERCGPGRCPCVEGHTCQRVPFQGNRCRPIPTTPSEPTTPEVTTPDVTTPDVTTPDVTTPEVTTPDVTTPDINTPEATTPEA